MGKWLHAWTVQSLSADPRSRKMPDLIRVTDFGKHPFYRGNSYNAKKCWLKTSGEVSA